ncbi:hypothetical protein M087_4828, partial [Bacteroides fragilis str. S23 R14]
MKSKINLFRIGEKECKGKCFLLSKHLDLFLLLRLLFAKRRFFYISIVVALCVSIIEYKVTPNQYIFELK